MSSDQPPASHSGAADPSADALLLAVGQLVRRFRKESDPSDLNVSQWSVLYRLEADGPATTADLARAEGMKPQSMGALIAGIEQEGFVERRPHPRDGRQVLLAITAAGLAARKARAAAKLAWMTASLERLDAGERAVLAAAIPLVRRLAEG